MIIIPDLKWFVVIQYLDLQYVFAQFVTSYNF